MTFWAISVLCLLSVPFLISSLPYGDVSVGLTSSKWIPYSSFGLPSSSSLGAYSSASGLSYIRAFPGYNFGASSNFGVQYGATSYPTYKTSAGLNQVPSGAAYNLATPHAGFGGGYAGYNGYSALPQPRVGVSAGPVAKTVPSTLTLAPVATRVGQQTYYPTGTGTSYGDFNPVGRKLYTPYGKTQTLLSYHYPPRRRHE